MSRRHRYRGGYSYHPLRWSLRDRFFAEARTNPPLVATPTGSAPYGAHFRPISARFFAALVPERRNSPGAARYCHLFLLPDAILKSNHQPVLTTPMNDLPSCLGHTTRRRIWQTILPSNSSSGSGSLPSLSFLSFSIFIARSRRISSRTSRSFTSATSCSGSRRWSG